jgi:phosphate transport system substrate-binding protein
MKKTVSTVLSLVLLAAALAGCGAENGAEAGADAPGFDLAREINVISREEGSGTRGAFIELFGIEQKGDDGTKKDLTTEEAEIVKQTDVMLQSVAGNPYAIGYVSMGSLNNTVKALPIDGAEPSTDNVKSGEYKISRPFNIATKGEAAGLAKDFIGYILSKEGQAIIAGGYIAVDENAPAYAGGRPSGRIVVAGSSSVTPIMEKLREAYIAVNPDAEIEIQMSDSSTGLKSALEGTCDIAMASRELNEAEKAELTGIEIAQDGIAVIVSGDNPAAGLTKDQVMKIYTGELTLWSDVVK